MIAVMQKLIKTTKSKISGGLYLTSFYKMYVQNLKYNIKEACMFHLILVGILSILILSVKNRGGWGGRVFVNGQNLLNVTKLFVDSPLAETIFHTFLELHSTSSKKRFSVQFFLF